MKITVDGFVLAEMSGPVGVRDFRIANQRAIESAQFLRADEGAFFDRRNNTVTVTFSVTRLHASVAEAELFLLAHEAEVPAGGLAVFTARGDDGQEAVGYLPDAVVSVTESGYVGASSRILYEIKGGRLQTQRPD